MLRPSEFCLGVFSSFWILPVFEGGGLGSIGGWWVRGHHQASQGRKGNARCRDLHSAEVALGFRRGAADEVRGGNPKVLRQVKGSGNPLLMFYIVLGSSRPSARWASWVFCGCVAAIQHGVGAQPSGEGSIAFVNSTPLDFARRSRVMSKQDLPRSKSDT